MFIVGIMIVRREVRADHTYFKIAHTFFCIAFYQQRKSHYSAFPLQAPPSATPPAPLPTPPESSELETDDLTFDMIAALLSMCVHKQYFYTHKMLSCYSKTHVMITLNCYAVYYSAPLLHMYRCWCSSHRGTDSPES